MLATEGEADGAADLFHAVVGEAADSWAYELLLDGYEVVQLDGADILHAVFDGKQDFGVVAPNLRSNRRHGYIGQVRD